MAERIYLGALLDINKEQYLPIMKEEYNKSNSFTVGNGCITKFDDTHIISSDANNLYIRNAYTLEVTKQISTEKPISAGARYPFIINQAKDKLYHMNITGQEVFVCIYDLINNTWSNHLVSLGSTSYAHFSSIQWLYLDDEYIYVFSNYNWLLKISLTNFSVVAFKSVPSSTRQNRLTFDGTYFYVAIVTNLDSYIQKLNKNDLTVLATSDRLLTGSNTFPATPTNMYYHNGFVYMVDTGNRGGGNFIYKVDANTLALIATFPNITPTNTMSVLYIDENNKLFGVSEQYLQEYDINTLALIASITLEDTTEHLQLFSYPKGGTLLYASSVASTQYERSYTIQSYKKVKEII